MKDASGIKEVLHALLAKVHSAMEDSKDIRQNAKGILGNSSGPAEAVVEHSFCVCRGASQGSA